MNVDEEFGLNPELAPGNILKSLTLYDDPRAPVTPKFTPPYEDSLPRFFSISSRKMDSLRLLTTAVSGMNGPVAGIVCVPS